MVEQDDWRLGDEPEPVACPSCGKRNRPGQPRCVICGAPLGDAPPDEPPLRTIGEAMGRGGRRRRERWWLWPLAATLLLALAGAAVWRLMPDEPTPEIADLPTAVRPMGTSAPPRAERTLPPPPLAPPVVAPAAVATVAPAPVRVPPTVMVFPPAVSAPPAPARTPIPPIAPTGVPRVPTPLLSPTAAPPRAPRAAAPAAGEGEETGDDEETPRTPDSNEPVAVPPDEGEEDRDAPEALEPPDADADAARDKAALGTDLRDATRAYRAAIDVHNERVDTYNAIADELQRRDFDDPEVPLLQRDLDRARADVERAREVAEQMRARMERVRAKYR